MYVKAWLRPLTHKSVQLVLVVGATVLTLTQFNNCSNYQPNIATDGTSSIDCTTTTNCIVPNPNNVGITAHLLNGTESILPSESEFNIGGDCNEGGYPYNDIHWDLMVNGQSVRNSSMQVAGGYTAESKCVNGRFLVYVNLGTIPGDSANRTGLNGQSASLVLTIYGQTQLGYNTNVQAQTTVPLNAVIN